MGTTLPEPVQGRFQMGFQRPGPGSSATDAVYPQLTARAPEGGSVVLAHTHVGHPAFRGFSDVDDAGEDALAPYLRSRISTRPHFSAVITHDGISARELGTRGHIDVHGVGNELNIWSARPLGAVAATQYDRQVRAFGQDGQRTLRQFTIAIVGLGGTGSVVALELARTRFSCSVGVATAFALQPSEIRPKCAPAELGAAIHYQER